MLRVVYITVRLGLGKTWFRSSIWISSVAGTVYSLLCDLEVTLLFENAIEHDRESLIYKRFPGACGEVY